MYTVPGERAVRELLEAAPRRVERVWLDDKRPWTQLLELAVRNGVATDRVPAEVLRRRFPRVESRGVVAVAKPPEWTPLDILIDRVRSQPHGTLVMLDEVADPQNLGAIMRTCEFFGAHGLVWTKDRAASMTPSVIRASAGASERLPLCQVTNLATSLQLCQDAGLWVVGTVVDDGVPIRELLADERLPEHLVLVMGSEGKGLRRLTRERCDFLATIERRGSVGSLNVSAAAAIAMAMIDASRAQSRSDTAD